MAKSPILIPVPRPQVTEPKIGLLPTGSTPLLAKFPPFDFSEITVLLSGKCALADYLWIAGQLTTLMGNYSPDTVAALKLTNSSPEKAVKKIWGRNLSNDYPSTDVLHSTLVSSLKELEAQTPPENVKVAQFNPLVLLPIIQMIFELIKRFMS